MLVVCMASPIVRARTGEPLSDLIVKLCRSGLRDGSRCSSAVAVPSSRPKLSPSKGAGPRPPSYGIPYPGEDFVTEINKDEKTVVAKSDFNVANVIAAIALLMLVLGALKYFGVSPI